MDGSSMVGVYMSLTAKQKKQWRSFFQAIRKHGLVGLSLTVLLAVDLVLNMVAMAILSPGPIERVGFVAVGVIIVALGVPAFLRGFKGLWLTFAILSAFLNTSFILEGTKSQASAITVETDSEIQRLDTLAATKESALSDWQSQYAKAVAGANMERIKDQLDQTRAELSKIQLDRSARYAIIEKGDARQVISSDDVFLSVPVALGIEDFPVSIIKLAFFGSLFFAMQRAIVIFAKGGNRVTKNQKGKQSDELVIQDGGPLYVKFDKDQGLGVSSNPVSSEFEDPLPFESNDEKKDKPAPFGSRELG
jgi:hypothetical protein